MGCSGTAESENKPKEEEEAEEPSEEKPKIEYNFDEHTLNYFKNFSEEEISIILERKKKIDPEINFVFIYSKFDIDYTDKNFTKTNTAICKEYLVCYVNPDYVGDFGYESQIIGFYPDKISLNSCYIQKNKVKAQMRNMGKIVSVLRIEENHKDDKIKDIMVFEFSYNITQIKKYGMRVIDVYYDEKPLTGSIRIKYDSNIFRIKSFCTTKENSKNEFYLFDKDKYCLTLIDKNNDLSIKNDESKFGKLIYKKFNEDEIKQINNSLNNMDIKPFEKNIIYEKMIHNLEKNTDFVKGSIIIFQPSFGQNYFELCEGIDKSPENVDFLVNELKVNDELLINVKKLSEKNRNKKPENYYESTSNAHRYNISINEDFILFEFVLEGIALEEDEDEIQYSLDARNIFNFFFSNGTYYKFEIKLNKHEIYFKDDESYNYKYKKTKEKIEFEGIWKLKEWDNKKAKKYIPSEIIIKKK